MGTSHLMCPNLNSFPFPLPQYTLPLGFHILGMEPPFTQYRNLIVIFNNSLSLTAHIQAVNRSPLNLLFPILYCHRWSDQWCLHIPQFHGCSTSYVLLNLLLILAMTCKHFLPLISVIPVSPCISPTSLVIPVSFYSTFPSHATLLLGFFPRTLSIIYFFLVISSTT